MSDLDRIYRRPKGVLAAQNFEATKEFQRILRNNPLIGGKAIYDLDMGSKDIIHVRHGLGRQYTGFQCFTHPGMLAIDPTVGRKDQTIALRVSVPWQLVETKVASEDTTSVTFTGLNGDVHEQYYFQVVGVSASGTAISLSVRLNGDSSNHAGAYIQVDNTTVTGVEPTSGFIMHTHGTHRSLCEGTIYALSGQARYGMYQSLYFDGFDGRKYTGMFRWSDTSANLTSIEFRSSTATQIGKGTEFRLFKRALRGEKIGLLVF